MKSTHHSPTSGRCLGGGHGNNNRGSQKQTGVWQGLSIVSGHNRMARPELASSPRAIKACSQVDVLAALTAGMVPPSRAMVSCEMPASVGEHKLAASQPQHASRHLPTRACPIPESLCSGKPGDSQDAVHAWPPVLSQAALSTKTQQSNGVHPWRFRRSSAAYTWPPDNCEQSSPANPAEHRHVPVAVLHTPLAPLQAPGHALGAADAPSAACSWHAAPPSTAGSHTLREPPALRPITSGWPRA